MFLEFLGSYREFQALKYFTYMNCLSVSKVFYTREPLPGAGGGAARAGQQPRWARGARPVSPLPGHGVAAGPGPCVVAAVEHPEQPCKLACGHGPAVASRWREEMLFWPFASGDPPPLPLWGRSPSLLQQPPHLRLRKSLLGLQGQRKVCGCSCAVGQSHPSSWGRHP